MNKLDVIKFLIEDTEKLREHARQYREDETRYREWKGNSPLVGYYEARSKFPIFFGATIPTKAKISANLRLIRRLSIEVQKEIEKEFEGGI